MRSVFYCAFFLYCFFSFLQFTSIKAQERPKLGIVLSGGGARGLAHVGALKVMEEAGIVPDYITGTSMGSIIAGLYSIGYTADEISAIIAKADWGVLLSDKIDLNNVLMEGKHEYGRYIIELPVRNKKIGLPPGLIEGQQLSEFFSRITWSTAYIESFDDFHIPYRCTASDIVNGEIVEFDGGDLAIAMRSSMAIPSVFTPVILDSNVLVVDGGVMRNFPVQEVREMGADIVIGVYTGFSSKISPEDLQSLPDVLARTTIFYGIFDSEKQAKLTNILIIPELTEFSPASFSDGDEIETRGENAARKMFDQLKSLADSLNTLGPVYPKKQLPANDSLLITKISVINTTNTTPDFIISKSGISENSWITPEIVSEGLEKVFGTLYYDKISYRFQKEEEGLGLVINVKEKSRSHLNFAIHYDDFYGIALTAGFTRINLFMKNTRFTTKIDISKAPRLFFDYHKYFGQRQNTILSLNMYAERDKLPIYVDGESVGQFSHSYLVGGLSSRQSLGMRQEIGIGFLGELSVVSPSASIKELIPDWNFNEYGFNNLFFSIFYGYNTLNNSLYPKRGLKIDILYKQVFLSSNVFKAASDTIDYSSLNLEAKPYRKFKFSLDYYKEISSGFVLNTELLSGFSSEDLVATDLFFVGGYMYNLRKNHVSFVGFNLNEISVDNFIELKLALRIQLWKNIFIDMIGNWMGEGNTLDEMFDNIGAYNENVHLGFGGGVTIKSPIGPLSFLTGTNTADYKLRTYLNLGFNF